MTSALDAVPEIDHNVTDRLAIVTGGGGGIGRAIALTLAKAGADVVIADIIPERCEEVAGLVRAMGRRALPYPLDVCDTDAIRAMVDAAKSEFGRIDILVNNAGGTGFRPFTEMSERSMRKHIDFNLMSMFAATSAAVPHMIEGGGGGAIINVTSIEGSRAAPYVAVYAACKAGMINFTKTMALELGDHNIRVNAIAPDLTETPGLFGNVTGPVDPSTWNRGSPATYEATKRRIALSRPGVDFECGQAALYLCSPMSSYVTGVVLPVDGGSFASSGWLRHHQTGRWSQTDAPKD